MKSKRELFIAKLEADRFYAIQRFDRNEIKRKVKRYARFAYLGLIGIFFLIVYASTFVENLNIFSGF